MELYLLREARKGPVRSSTFYFNVGPNFNRLAEEEKKAMELEPNLKLKFIPEIQCFGYIIEKE